MNNKKYKKYILATITLLKELARKAKAEANNLKEGFKDYAEGTVMGYYSIITLFKHEAFAFCIDQKELGLADIDPEKDLLGLVKNPDIDFEENYLANNNINEETLKGYFGDSITLLKEQAKKAKLEVYNSQKDFESYNKGELMAYRLVFLLLKHQATFFNVDENELGLADIEPDRDLV